MTDVVVIGGGVLGSTLAWRTALAGAQVVWLRPDPVGSASAAAGAMLSVLSEAAPWQDEETRLLEVMSRAKGRAGWGSWLAELAEDAWSPAQPRDVPRLQSGVYVVARTAADVDSLRTMRADADRLQIKVEDLHPVDVPGYRPDRSMAAVDAVHLPDEGTVDTRVLLAAIEHAARLAGADVRAARVRRLTVAGDGVTADTDSGPVEASHVVLATGAETTALLRDSGLEDLLPPVLGGRGVAAVVRAARPVAQCVRTPNRAFACGLHLVPRADGTSYLGATNRLTTRVDTASAAHLDELTSLLGCATSELDVGLRTAELVRTVVGHRPVTLDRLPLVGRTAVPQVLVATATWRNGVALAPYVAELIATELAEPGSTREHAFAPTRSMTAAGFGPDVLRRGAQGIVDTFFEGGASGLTHSSEMSAFLEVALGSLVGSGDDGLARLVGRLLEQAPLEEVLPTVHDLVVRSRE